MIGALRRAAEFEHGTMCQYLFAAFALKHHPSEGAVTWPQLEIVREWKSALLLVARQEMEHLGLVCNLLAAIGGAPNLEPARDGPGRLERLNPDTIRRFIAIETEHGEDVGIGKLYREIRRGFVELAEGPAMLFVGPRAAQVANAELELRPRAWDVELERVVDLDSALRCIDRIVDAGRGEAASSHAARFEAIAREYQDLRRDAPGFEPARPVCTDPRLGLELELERDDDDARAGTPIRAPLTRAALELFNDAYEVLLLLLARYYGYGDETPAERAALMRFAFFPLMTSVIRPLGEVLTQMPVDDEGTATAGPGFELRHASPLSPIRESAWIVLHERLAGLHRQAAALADAIAGTSAAWATIAGPRLRLLEQNCERIAAQFEQDMGLSRVYARALLQRLS